MVDSGEEKIFVSVGENICYLSVVGCGVAWAGGAAGRHGGQLRLLPGVVLGAAVVVVADHHQGGSHDQQQQAGRGQVSYSENNSCPLELHRPNPLLLNITGGNDKNNMNISKYRIQMVFTEYSMIVGLNYTLVERYTVTHTLIHYSQEYRWC